MNIGLGFHVGLTNSSVSFHDNENTENLNQEFSSSQNPVFGFFVNFMDPNISERFSVQLDLLFTSGNYTAGSSTMDISYLKLPISLKYTYGVKKIKPSFWIGLAYNKWSKFSDKNIVPEHLSGDAIQKRRYQYGLYTGFELATALGTKTDLFFQVKYEYYSGRHLNKWSVPGLTVQDYSKSKTAFLTFSTGVKF